MPSQHTRGSTHHDVWIEHPRGRLFARVWSPAERPGGPAGDSPIVLFHDSLGCVELWRSFPATLCASTGRRVLAYDRLGFGKSDPRHDRPGLDFIADEARTYFPAVRRGVGFDRFIAFGHSVGGGMAVHCAAEFTGACEALITEAAQVFPEDRTLQGITLAREQFKAAGQVERLERYHGKKARWVLDAWTESWLHPDFAAWSLEPVLPRVTCPLLAIHGVHDEYGTTRHPETIARLSGGTSRLEIMPDTHHVPHREHERVVVQLVQDFIASIG
jgi:pimeloyl-ACP methyl ester carboxylesterase